MHICFKNQFIFSFRLVTFPQDIRKAIELWGNDLPNMDILEFEDESLKKHLDIMLGKDSNKIQFLVTSILNGNLVKFAF